MYFVSAHDRQCIGSESKRCRKPLGDFLGPAPCRPRAWVTEDSASPATPTVSSAMAHSPVTQVAFHILFAGTASTAGVTGAQTASSITGAGPAKEKQGDMCPMSYSRVGTSSSSEETSLPFPVPGKTGTGWPRACPHLHSYLTRR